MPQTTEFDEQSIKDEFLNFLRYSVNSLDPQGRVTETTTTETYSNLNNGRFEPSNMLSYVKNVIVNSTDTLTFGEDYTIHYRDDIISGTTKQGEIELLGSYNSSDSIKFTYGEITEVDQNWIYPDFPRIDLSPSSYPRVGFNMTTSTDEYGQGGGNEYALSHDITFQVRVAATSQARVLAIHKVLREAITQNAKNFYNVNYITQQDFQDLNNFQDDNSDTHFYKELQYTAPRKKEIIQYA